MGDRTQRQAVGNGHVMQLASVSLCDFPSSASLLAGQTLDAVEPCSDKDVVGCLEVDASMYKKTVTVMTSM
jgi:hypothetical protein